MYIGKIDIEETVKQNDDIIRKIETEQKIDGRKGKENERKLREEKEKKCRTRKVNMK